MGVKYEITEEIEDNMPIYWIVRKSYIWNFHISSQLIGMDAHGELPFFDLFSAEEKLKYITDYKKLQTFV